MFFGLFKKKQNYCDIDLQDCIRCNSSVKLQKCQDCGLRTTCKMCIGDHPLCKECDIKWEKFYDNLEKIAQKEQDKLNQAKKLHKYNTYATSNKYQKSLLETGTTTYGHIEHKDKKERKYEQAFWF